MKHLIARCPRLLGTITVVVLAVETLGAARKWH
jgi:hypothetical protein